MAEETETPQPSKKGGLIKTILIVVLGLAVVGDVAFRVVQYLRHAPATQASHEAPGEAHQQQLPPSAPPAKPGHKKPDSKSTMNLDAFLVNLADKDSARFIKVVFRLGLDEPALGEEFSKDGVALGVTRDAIVSILSSKTSEEVMTPEGKDRLRDEIRERVNTVLPKGKVKEVFIMDFVIQL